MQFLQKQKKRVAICAGQQNKPRANLPVLTMKTQLLNFVAKHRYVCGFMLLSLFFHVLAGIVSMGYHQADEHFQILEPIGWKLGFYGSQDLAWEFTEKIRSGIQIFLGYAIGKALLWGGVYSPFTLAGVLRQLSGVLWWALTWAFYAKWKNQFSLPFLQKALLVFSALLWFLPYLHVRYSSESWGGLLFFFGLYICLYLSKEGKGRFLPYLFGGLLMGLSFYFRFQMAFAIVGFLGWMLWYKKFNLSTFSGLLFGALIAISIGTLADYWLYGEWVLTHYNYFFQNIVEGKAAGFGTNPFYSYVPMFIEHTAMPLSPFLLVLLFLGIWAGRKNPFTWVLVVFVIAHSAVAHKEFRFLFPMVAIMPLIFTQGLGVVYLWFEKLNPSVVKFTVRAFITINVVLLGLSMAKPASEQEALFKAFYIVQKEHKNTKIAFTQKDPFDNGLKMNFFRYCNDCFYKWEEGMVKENKTELYIYTRKLNELPNYAGTYTQLEYSTAPIVSQTLNFGHWQERTNNGFLWHISTNRSE